MTALPTNDADHLDAAGALLAIAGRSLRRAAAAMRQGRFGDAQAIMAEGCGAMDRAVALMEENAEVAA